MDLSIRCVQGAVKDDNRSQDVRCPRVALHPGWRWPAICADQEHASPAINGQIIQIQRGRATGT